MRKGQIVSTGMYAPERVVSNSYFDDLYQRDMGTFLREKRNVYTRHFMAPDQATSDLIVPAAQEAMAQATVSAEEIDLIIVATDTPDYISPATAVVVQHKLGAKNAGAFDVNAACSGFATALDMANKYIASDPQYRNILVAGAYGMSKYFDWEDYKVTSVFADGAGAVIVQATDGPYGILASQLTCQGVYHDYMGIYAGGTHTPIDQEAIEKKLHLLQFVKRIPNETNVREWPLLTMSVLDRINKQKEDISHFFMTQINIGSINETLDQLGLPRERAHNIMDRYGYTGSACIPMALADAVKKKKLRQGDLLMLIGSGGGMAMAAVALTWGFDT